MTRCKEKKLGKPNFFLFIKNIEIHSRENQYDNQLFKLLKNSYNKTTLHAPANTT